ncbi:MAG: ABC transporter permease [Nitrospirae bacterium]|nr:MAG: ABC transporter permease [Nitrospirota bacterium]
MMLYLLRRLAAVIPIMFGLACLVFFLLHLIPGDPVEVMLGEAAHPAEKEALRRALGLHLPLHTQLWHYVQGLVMFDFGTSIFSGRPILDILLERLPATIELGVAALAVAVMMAVPFGVLAAVRHKTVIDFGAMGFSLLGMSIPNFWLGPLLILIGAVWLGWFPVSGREGWRSLILPALTLGVSMAAILSRMVRSSLLEVIREDYIRTARAKGLAEWTVIVRHGLRTALLPVLTLLGLQLGALLSGAVITETIFAWPGIGSLTVEAIQRRDYPVVQAAVLWISFLYVVVNAFTDVLYAWLDPRVRTEESP